MIVWQHNRWPSRLYRNSCYHISWRNWVTRWVLLYVLRSTIHYMNQCWLIIGWVQWHSFEGHFTSDTSAINRSEWLENVSSTIEFEFLRDIWVHTGVAQYSLLSYNCNLRMACFLLERLSRVYGLLLYMQRARYHQALMQQVNHILELIPLPNKQVAALIPCLKCAMK